MIVRPSIITDIPHIISLIKSSLGESLMPKSKEYWEWKHNDNPFGSSPVWVAEEDGELIGVRAFMKWQWQQGSRIINAIRAVDTATSPAHQGKGIFKRLTLSLLEECRKKGIDMVYNTPNSKSKPGYLKMGWEEVGKLPIQLTIKKPLSVIHTKLQKPQLQPKFLSIENGNYSLETAFKEFNFSFKNLDNRLHTNYSNKYLKWRYQQIPIIPYYAHFNESACCIFRLKLGELGTELRVADVFGEYSAAKSLLDELFNSKIDFNYMTIDGFSKFKLRGFIKFKVSLGPEVTIRELLLTELKDFRNFDAWSPTLGDLEVF